MAAISDSSAVSKLATTFVPGVPFTVTIIAIPAAETVAYAVEDRPPAGWSVSLIQEGGLYDAVNQKVKWMFVDNTPRTLTYQVTPIACAPDSTLAFTGTAAFDSLLGGQTVAIAGLRSTTFDTADAPRIADINRQNATRTRLTILGLPGKVHAIQTSSDLQEWATIAESTPAEAIFQFSDTNAAPDRRFYRVILK